MNRVGHWDKDKSYWKKFILQVVQETKQLNFNFCTQNNNKQHWTRWSRQNTSQQCTQMGPGYAQQQKYWSGRLLPLNLLPLVYTIETVVLLPFQKNSALFSKEKEKINKMKLHSITLWTRDRSAPASLSNRGNVRSNVCVFLVWDSDQGAWSFQPKKTYTLSHKKHCTVVSLY